MAQALVRPFSGGEHPELEAIQSLIRRAGRGLRSEVVCEVSVGRERLPLYCLEMGPTDPEVPAVGFFGGIHGVERIGSHVLLAWLQSLVERLEWDELLHDALQRVRLVFMPLINPGGMRRRTRANPAGVDLMRNAPVDADHSVLWPLGGQRLTSMLPWYRGRRGAEMQPEAQALCRIVEERLLTHRFSMSLDCHSGFGMRDHVWFPYARSRQPIDCLADIYTLRNLFYSAHPYHHTYLIEPQSRRYTTHGDLWDYLYDRGKTIASGRFIPLTLEMGSWMWVKKRPAQAFSMLGIFNPIAPHRHQRILRRHLVLFEFLIRAATSHRRWLPDNTRRHALHESARTYWYDPQARPPAPLHG